ncbi:MAG: prepilin-type N-terminal cleavage/methylation domain-containing protein [Nitrospira sp.]|nr:prepilin-type N-terminal cleavage/methylation domain-containing protein [Nitrospira sp.]
MKSAGHILCDSKKNGFTLIELIIVLFMIGIVAGLAGIYIGKDTGSLDLKKFTREVASVMRYARNHAVTEKKIYCFVIDKDDRRLRLYSEDTDYTNVTLVMDKDIPEELDINMPGIAREALYVEFFPLGNTSGGVIEIMNAKGSSFFISVNRVTGKLVVEKE